MSEPQRRYIFRLAAARGVTPEGVEGFLADHFGVEKLASLSRFGASKLIDELLVSAGGEAASRADALR